ncbi:hypothetical protein BJX68DRAFT_267204 [Aspergillus pseudodeflectus]|uniref:F-box domain-containing protein n=1 Tax=Aspergillus pseudodeflectus TaxID=176178 RepID=A0ABR4KAN9_9EURO
MFQDLPPEIQILVTRELDTTDQVNLVYTSRYFYELLIPQLYEALPDATQYCKRLVDSLVRNPALRNYPRCIRLEACHVRGPDEEKEDDGDSSDANDDIKDIRTDKANEDDHPATWLYNLPLQTQYAKEVCISEGDGNILSSAIWKNDDGAHALLLTLVPGLVRLDLQFPRHGRLTDMVVTWATQGRFAVPVLQNLHEVFVSSEWGKFQEDGADEIITDWALTFLWLPSLRRFKTDALRDVVYECRVPDRRSSVTHIEISKCLGLEDVKGFIAAFPNLQSYRHSYVTTKWNKPLSSRRMYQALLQAKETLREIWLDICVQNFVREPAGLKWPTFTNFTALEVLHIPIFLLEDLTGEPQTINLTQFLPRTLKTMHIFDATYITLPNLLPSLLEYITSPHSQNLTELIIATTPHYVEGSFFIIMDDSIKKGLTDGPSISDELSRRLKELEYACHARCVTFDFQVLDGSSKLAAAWEFEDPFDKSR